MYTDTRAKVIGRDRRRVGVALVSSLRLWAGVGADDITDDVTAGSGLRCLPFEQPSEGTANRPLLTKFKSFKSSQWQSALFIISWNPLSKSVYLNCMTWNVELIASCCIGEEFDRTLLFGFGVELLECFVVVFLRQQAGQSSQRIICDKLYQSIWLLYFPEYRPWILLIQSLKAISNHFVIIWRIKQQRAEVYSSIYLRSTWAGL